MPPPWRDARRFHLVTRGNVDGIVSAALFLARHADLKVSFVTSTSGALDALRRDIQSHTFFLADLGLTDDLLHAVRQKAKAGTRVHLLDHHQQSEGLAPERGLAGVARQGISAGALVHDFLGLDGDHEHLAAIADVIEYCRSDALERATARYGLERLTHEARILDFAWRFEVDDDRFRLAAARRLAEGRWPSAVPEIHSRYLQVVNEGRWERALDKVRARLRVRDGVAVLRFGRYRTSLLGFGTRAVSQVAAERGCRVALLINSRKLLTSLSLRGVGPEYGLGARPRFNLGRFAQDFTAEHGLAGGGHPSSAGAKIYTRHVPVFIEQVRALA